MPKIGKETGGLRAVENMFYNIKVSLIMNLNKM